MWRHTLDIKLRHVRKGEGKVEGTKLHTDV